jgi:hypothetical protein
MHLGGGHFACVTVSLNPGLVSRARPESSLVGIVIAAAAVVVMPLLGVTKRRLDTYRIRTIL